VPDRSADEIQREIERARDALADAVDQLAVRTSPQRLAAQAKQGVREWAQTTQGKAVIGGTGFLMLVVVVRGIRNRGK
jgi:hypothetical protein